MISLIWLIATKVYFLHPFHVSVCDVVYKSDDKHLKISVRVFLDDLEDGLQEFTGNEKFDITKADSAVLFTHLRDYLLSNLAFTTRDKKIDISFLGGEVESDVIWCYLENEKLKPFDEMTVVNSILSTTFDDQENLVHVRKDGVVKSMRMRGKDVIQSARWD